MCAAALTPSAIPAFAAGSSTPLRSVTSECSGPALTSASYTQEGQPRGDLNKDGLINATDATIVLVEYSSMSTGSAPSFSSELFAAADLNNDDTIDSSDASIILYYYSYISTGGTKNIEEMYPRPVNILSAVTTTAAENTVTTSSAEVYTTAPDSSSANSRRERETVPYSSSTSTTASVTTMTSSAAPDIEKVTDIRLSHNSMELEIGESGLAARVTVFPLNATDQRVIWSSSDESVASVNDQGWVTAYKEGLCTIKAESAESPEIFDTVDLSVVDPYRVRGIRISKDSLSLSVGEGSLAASVTFLPTDARTAEAWSSSDPSVAVVDGSGWVQGVAPGTCTITVSSSTDPDIKAEIIVTVVGSPISAPESTASTAASTTTTTTTTTTTSTTTTTTATTTTVTTTTEVKLSGITADKSTLNMEIGDKETVALSFLPDNATKKDVLWESSAPAVASVDKDGLIHAKKAGACVVSAVSASNRNIKAQIIVNVTDPNAVIVREIELTRYDMTLNIGYCELSAWVTMYPANAQDKSEKWESSDVTVATVDKDGWVYGRKAGECIITVYSAANPEVKAEIKVTVKNPYAPVTTTTIAATTAAPVQTTTATTTAAAPVTSRISQYVEKRNGVTYINGILVVNKSYSLPETYAPGMNQTASAQFNKLAADAALSGLSIRFNSGYRSYRAQEELYNNYVLRDGQVAADTYSARPGHSEHQTGLAIDVNSASTAFADTREAAWLAVNAHKYGFIIRYPKGKEAITGFNYEPWHIRFVGVQTANKIYESGLCLEEYLGIDSFYEY